MKEHEAAMEENKKLQAEVIPQLFSWATSNTHNPKLRI
jgi:hypothetical protein